MRNDLGDFNDAYIVVTGKITATGPDPDKDNILYERKLAFKNSAPSYDCILKINGNFNENSQDLDSVVPMYNLLYYPKNFRKVNGSFWNYYPDMPNSEYVGNNERTKIFNPIGNSKSLDYRTNLVGTLPDGKDDLEDIKIVVPLKNLSNFMFNLDFLLINSEIELTLKWTENCVLAEIAEREAKPLIPAQVANAEVPALPAVNVPSELKFSITDCKMYVPVVALQAEYQNQLYK